jgi:hypothetical protein
MRGTNHWRRDLLVEAWPTGFSPPYAAVVSSRFVYVETEGDRSELYDLDLDPYQLENRIDCPEYAALVARLAQRLDQLREV